MFGSPKLGKRPAFSSEKRPNFGLKTHQEKYASFLEDDKTLVIVNDEQFSGSMVVEILTKVTNLCHIFSAVCHHLEGKFIMVVKLDLAAKAVVARIRKENSQPKWIGSCYFNNNNNDKADDVEVGDPLASLRLEHANKIMRLLVDKRAGVDFSANDYYKLSVVQDGEKYYVEIPPGEDPSMYFQNPEYQPTVLRKNEFCLSSVIGGVNNSSHIQGLERHMMKAGPVQAFATVQPPYSRHTGIFVWYRTAEAFHRALAMHQQRQQGYQFTLTIKPVVDDNLDLPERRQPVDAEGDSYVDPVNGSVSRMYNSNEAIPRGLLSTCVYGQHYDISVTELRLGSTEALANISKPNLLITKESPQPNSLTITLKDRIMHITHMAIRTIPLGVNAPHLRSFVIEAKLKGTSDFQKIASVSLAEELNRSNHIQIYELEYKDIVAIRLVQTGKNWRGTSELSIAGIDFFGSLATKGDEANVQKMIECNEMKKKIRALRGKLENRQMVLAKQQAQVQVMEEEKIKRRNTMKIRKRDRFMEMLYLQFCDCFELPLRKALPDMSERDIEFTLQAMFQRLPDDMQPHAI